MTYEKSRQSPAVRRRLRHISFLLLLAFSVALLDRMDANASGDPFLLNDYALHLLQKGETEKALDQLQKAYSLFPYDETLKKNLAEVFTVVGQKRMASGRYEEAVASFDAARELYPDNQRYSILRGIALYSSRQYDAAIVELERARGLGGDTPDLLYFLGRAHYDSGNLQAALEFWDKALELDPGQKEISKAVAKARRELAVEGRMAQDYSSRFVVSYEGDVRSNLADQVLDTLETAYNRVGSDFSFFPDTRIPVILYTKTDYRKVTNSPDWSGGLYDGKIRLPIGGASEMNKELNSLLFHEYTHVVVHLITSGNCPVWLNEGLAELEGHRESGYQLNELARAVKQGNLLPLSTLEHSFSALSTREASLAYQQSYSLVNYMVSTYGWYKVKDILLALGTGKKISAAISTALDDLGVDYPSVYQEWLSAAQREFAR